MERLKLRLKILAKYGSITKFCEDIGYSRVQVSNIIYGRVVGSVEFWKITQKKLKLSDGEVWRMQNIIVGEHNGKN